MATRDYWFQLVDANGIAVMDVTFVRLSTEDQTVAHLRKQIVLEYPNTFASVEASQLSVYRRRLDFDDKVNGQPMQGRTSLKTVDTDLQEDTLWVVVRPASVPLVATMGYSDIVRGKNDVRPGYEKERESALIFTNEAPVSGQITREGLALDKDTYASRQTLCNEIIEFVDKQGMLLIRAPPMTGKTSLRVLIRQQLIARQFTVVTYSCVQNVKHDFIEEFNRTGMRWLDIVRHAAKLTPAQPIYLIVDEAQGECQNGGAALWGILKAVREKLYLRIICFAAYGEINSSNLSAVHASTTVTPPSISKELIWNIERILFTREEAREFFDKFFAGRHPNAPAERTSLFKSVFAYSGGHPGIFSELIFALDKKYRLDVNSVSYERIWCYLFGATMLSAIKSIRTGCL